MKRKTNHGQAQPIPHSKEFIEAREKMAEESILNQIKAGHLADLNRARGISIGSAFGGTVEISLRRGDGVSIHAILQPVEAIELLHQMSASLGCHLQLTPRNDFASWRDWKPNNDGLLPIDNHPPMIDNYRKHSLTGIMPPPLHPAQIGTNLTSKRNNENVVAIKKNIDRRSTKRITKAS